MNKIIVLFLTLAPIVCYAADTMCVKPTTTVVVLDPNINGTALASNATGKTWSAQFPYGIISGIGGYSTTGNKAYTARPDQTGIGPYITGAFCYCKMLRPIESKWITVKGTNGSGWYGSQNCEVECLNNIVGNSDFRAGLFGNIDI